MQSLLVLAALLGVALIVTVAAVVLILLRQASHRAAERNQRRSKHSARDVVGEVSAWTIAGQRTAAPDDPEHGPRS